MVEELTPAPRSRRIEFRNVMRKEYSGWQGMERLKHDRVTKARAIPGPQGYDCTIKLADWTGVSTCKPKHLHHINAYVIMHVPKNDMTLARASLHLQH